jgi:hypothetical protein
VQGVFSLGVSHLGFFNRVEKPHLREKRGKTEIFFFGGYHMKFPVNTPAFLSSLILSNKRQCLLLEEETVGTNFQVKAWSMKLNGSSVGLQVSVSFLPSPDGEKIEKFPIFPEEESEKQALKKKLCSFYGWLNLPVDELTEEQFSKLSILQNPSLKENLSVQLFGNLIMRFYEKEYEKEGLKMKVTTFKMLADPESFKVGMGETFNSLFDIVSKIEKSRFN